MTTETPNEPTLEERLTEIPRDLHRANRKLDRMIYLVEDGYHRMAYELY